MNIVLTRPLIDTENLMSELLSLGHKIIHIPTLKISKVPLDPVDLNNYNAIIFTSANAIRSLNITNKQSNIKCFCVGSITEKIVRSQGFNNTFSAGGTVNALKNLILITLKKETNSKIAYFCGDVLSSDLDKELKTEGYFIDKFVNYNSEKITELNSENKKLIEKYPPNLIFIYSMRSAESFNSMIKKNTLATLMTQSTLMCISDNIILYLKKAGWKKLDKFTPGEEIIKIESLKNGNPFKI